MKVLLFTHEQDIDGMGCAVIGKIAFPTIKCIPCKTFEITEKVKDTIDSREIYKYDMIFVTDLCIKEPILTKIANDSSLNQKLIILDHHKSEIEEGNNKYPFVHIIVENQFGKVSGTSLFYEYLVKNKFLKPTKVLTELVELTRQYDTWEWKKYQNEKARKLHILFEEVGYQKYVDIMLKLKEENTIKFTEDEQQIITKFDNELKKSVNEILNNMYVHTEEINKTIYKIGYISIPYKYRNELNEFVMSNNVNDIDVLGMIMTDIDTVSYRKVKDLDVSKIAVHFGGKGHKSAGSNPQNNEKFAKVLKKVNNYQS